MRGKDMMERIAEIATRSGEPILQQPLLELCGEHRVLIEHHKGIEVYAAERVDVKVRFGTIGITGTSLEICKMTAEQLVITGDINSITLSRRSYR